MVQSALVALQKGRLDEREIIRLYKDIARRLLQKNINPVKMRAVIHFLRYHVSFEKPENISNFEKEISTLTNNSYTTGIEEMLLDMAEQVGIEKGIEKGREESKYLFVKSLLEATDFSDEKIASVASADVAFVKKVKAEIGLRNSNKAQE